jgi:hypothetical protein
MSALFLSRGSTSASPQNYTIVSCPLLPGFGWIGWIRLPGQPWLAFLKLLRLFWTVFGRPERLPSLDTLLLDNKACIDSLIQHFHWKESFHTWQTKVTVQSHAWDAFCGLMIHGLQACQQCAESSRGTKPYSPGVSSSRLPYLNRCGCSCYSNDARKIAFLRGGPWGDRIFPTPQPRTLVMNGLQKTAFFFGPAHTFRPVNTRGSGTGTLRSDKRASS